MSRLQIGTKHRWRVFNINDLMHRALRNKRVVLALVVGIPIALYVLFGSRGVVQRVKLENQKAELEAKVREAEAETQRLQSESRALDGNKEAIEKVAREKYGMIRKGETVYKVNKKK